jgi:hypothetical protein
MADPTPTPAAGDSRGYKRSWKNLLINKRYQLRFTLVMVGLSAGLMLALGTWVKRVADNTTEVGLARVRGEQCPPLPTVPTALQRPPHLAPAPTPLAETPASPPR